MTPLSIGICWFVSGLIPLIIMDLIECYKEAEEVKRDSETKWSMFLFIMFGFLSFTWYVVSEIYGLVRQYVANKGKKVKKKKRYTIQ